MSLIEVMTGQEDVTGANLLVSARYVNHASCPIKLDGVNNTLALLAKSGRVGPTGKTVSKLQSQGPSYLDTRNALLAAKGKFCGWYKNVYECPDNLVIKLDIKEASTVFGKRPLRGIICIKIRETGPYCQVTFKKGFGLESLIKGRFDLLTPEYIIKHGLTSHFSEASFIDPDTVGEFLGYEILRPALVELEESVTVHEINGERVEFVEEKKLRKVMDIF